MKQLFSYNRLDVVQLLLWTNALILIAPLTSASRANDLHLQDIRNPISSLSLRKTSKYNPFQFGNNSIKACGECSPSMACSPSENKCICVDPEDMIYDSGSMSCLSLVYGACFIQPIVEVVKDCVQNAVCKPVNELTGYCECENGYLPTSERLCTNTGETAGTTIKTSTNIRESTTTEIVSSSTTLRTTEIPGIIHPPGIIGQYCNPATGKSCIKSAVCVDQHCICTRNFIHAENFKSCVSSALNPIYFKIQLTPWLFICLILYVYTLFDKIL